MNEASQAVVLHTVGLNILELLVHLLQMHKTRGYLRDLVLVVSLWDQF